MFNRKKQVFFLVVLAIISLLAGFFDYEPLWNKVSDARPWRFGLDLAGGTFLTYEIDLSSVTNTEKDSVVRGLRDVIEKRVNPLGVGEPRVYVQKAAEHTRLIVELAGIKDVDTAIKLIGETPFLDFREFREVGTSTLVVPTQLTGRYIVNAELSRDPTTYVPEINFSLNDEGGKMFQEITKRNAGKPLCVFIDNAPIIPESPEDSCPNVQGEISGGKARITGQFGLDKALKIVERFNAGALSAPVELINQQTISAEFGKDALAKAVKAGVIGTLLVILFIIIYYRRFGVFASIALLMYIAITLSIFKLIPITLTLAGIAGVILSIGMAVDANILVFERTKEELKKGQSRLSAIEQGFSRAWPSIRDSNISTMITSAVLYYFTTGFVKGFALALFLGVIISMFSAITITRALLRIFLNKENKK